MGGQRSALLCRGCWTSMGEITPGETVIDAAVQYAQHIPVNVIGRMLGFPEKDEQMFREFVHDALWSASTKSPARVRGDNDLGAYIAGADRGPP